MGGTDYDREGIAGLGVAVAGATMMQIKGETASGATFAIQGVGAMGAAVLRYFSEMGARLTALGDPRYGGTWTFDDFLSADLHDTLVNQALERASALLKREAKLISRAPEDVLYQPTDILFPCAVQNVVTAANVASIHARYVCEGANGPVTDEAREALYARGIPLMPDFIANGGGVIAAFVELTSTGANKADQAKTLVREKIERNAREMFEIAERCRAQPQEAALHLALKKMLGDA